MTLRRQLCRHRRVQQTGRLPHKRRSLVGAPLTLYCCAPKFAGRRQTGRISSVTPSSARAHRQRLGAGGLAVFCDG